MPAKSIDPIAAIPMTSCHWVALRFLCSLHWPRWRCAKKTMESFSLILQPCRPPHCSKTCHTALDGTGVMKSRFDNMKTIEISEIQQFSMFFPMKSPRNPPFPGSAGRLGAAASLAASWSWSGDENVWGLRLGKMGRMEGQGARVC